MKALVGGVVLAVAVGGLLQFQSASHTESYRVVTVGHIAPITGTKSERQLRPVPVEIGARLVEGEQVEMVTTWNPLLDMGYEIYQLHRDGGVLVVQANRSKYFIAFWAVTAAPLVLALLIGTLTTFLSRKEEPVTEV